MKNKMSSIVISSITILLLVSSAAMATPGQKPMSTGSTSTTVSSGTNYQGRLTNPDGKPLNGTFTMRFIVYDDQIAGSAIWDSGDLDITVEDGLFNVKLALNQADFDGKALWLSIIVDGETLSPRQEILPAPYALSLRPGANIISEDGSGLRVSTDGTDETDYGVHITSTGGFGVYAQSSQNQAVRGEAGDVTGIITPLDAVGIVGIGAGRGAFGASQYGSGVYGRSDGNYGVWGHSDLYRGVTGRTDRVDNNYGLYTPDNLYSLNYHLAGAIMQVMQNVGENPLSLGDVVVFRGINKSVTAVDAPIVQVSKAVAANSTAVAGVVYSRFNIDAIDPKLESPDGSLQEIAEVTPSGEVPPGEYLLVVVQGPTQVNVNALGGTIQPGDLLSTSSIAGAAGKAEMVTVNGVGTAIPGTVFGKALEHAGDAQTVIYVYVSLQ